MLASTLCHNYLNLTAPKLHSRRKKTISTIVESLVGGAHLTINSLGRQMSGKAAVKHKINAVWRLFSKSTFSQDLPYLYEGITQPLLKSMKHCVILVDWSGCCDKQNWLLRASLVYDGRALPLYNEVHPVKCYNSHDVHQKFLEQLRRIIPVKKSVTIITDAAFKGPWFRVIASMGWFYIGRGRGCSHCDLNGHWYSFKALESRAQTGKSTYLGKGTVNRSRVSFNCHFVLFRQHPKGRRFKRKRNTINRTSINNRYQDKNKTAWLLLTNLPVGHEVLGHSHLSAQEQLNFFAATVSRLYHKRMQIEQNFRDDKNTKWGFGWREGRSKKIRCLEGLCFIATLSTILLLLIGSRAEDLKLHFRYQANSLKSRRVISLVNLGKQFLRHQDFLVGKKFIKQAIISVQKTYEKVMENAYGF